MSTQLYAQFDHGSFAIVSRALTHVLKRAAVDATVYAYGSLSPRYIDIPFQVAMNSHADTGIFVGYPRESLGWLTGHEKSIILTVCESSPVPPEWIYSLNKTNLVVVPSEFCRDALLASRLQTHVIVCPHGVPASFMNVPPQKERVGRVRLLHVSEAGSFPWRKGTSQLIQAFRRIQETFPNVDLYIKSDSLQLDKVLRGGDRIYPLSTLRHAATIPSFYHAFDAVVQPSRGEGFGLVPLEARCLGIPVALTASTGHLQHIATDVDTVIPVGPSKRAETQGNAGGSMPTVSVDEVERALMRLLGNLEECKAKTRAWAASQGPRWTWTRVLTPLVKHIVDFGGISRLYDLDEEHGVRGF